MHNVIFASQIDMWQLWIVPNTPDIYLHDSLSEERNRNNEAVSIYTVKDRIKYIKGYIFKVKVLIGDIRICKDTSQRRQEVHHDFKKCPPYQDTY